MTHGGHDELEERLAVRPTSESIIAPWVTHATSGSNPSTISFSRSR